MNLKRIHREWQQQGLRLPSRERRRKFRTRAIAHPKAKTPHDVWIWDFVHDTYGHDIPLRCLPVNDGAISGFVWPLLWGRSLTHQNVMEVLCQLITRHGRLRDLRSDNGPEMIAYKLRAFLKGQEIIFIRIEPGKPWQNGSSQSFNGTFRRKCLDAELFQCLSEA